MPSSDQAVRNAVALIEDGGIELDVLVYMDRTIVATPGRYQPELSLLLFRPEKLLLITGREPLLFGQYPDLQQMRFICWRAEFAVQHAGPGGHPLDLVRVYGLTVTHRIAVRQLARD